MENSLDTEPHEVDLIEEAFKKHPQPNQPSPAMLPTNLPLALVNIRPWEEDVIERVLRDNTSLEENILSLTQYWKLRFWFKEPVLIKTRPTKIRLPDEGVYKCYTYRHGVTTTNHVFNSFFKNNFCLYYLLATNSRKGYVFPINKVEKYDLIIKNRRYL